MKSTLQKVEPQKPALIDKGKGKMVDVTNVPSSSTSTSFLPKSQPSTRVTRPKVVTQEPTLGKTSSPKKDTQHVEKETDTQEPTSTMEVEPQEPIFPHDNARIEELLN